MFEKERPQQGFRHVLKRRDPERFIELIPHWDEHCRLA
jgi:hypothetical protein